MVKRTDQAKAIIRHIWLYRRDELAIPFLALGFYLFSVFALAAFGAPQGPAQ